MSRFGIALIVYVVAWFLFTAVACIKGQKGLYRSILDDSSSKEIATLVYVLTNAILGLVWPVFLLVNVMSGLMLLALKVRKFKFMRKTREGGDYSSVPQLYGVAYEKIEPYGDGYSHFVYWLPVPVNVIVGLARSIFLDLRSGFVRQGLIEAMLWRAYMAGRWFHYEDYFGDGRKDYPELRIICGDCGEVIATIGLDEPFDLDARYDDLGGVCTACQVNYAAAKRPGAGQVSGILRRK